MWLDVLPYCIVNCLITCLVVFLKQNKISISFSPQGHAALGLLVSFLVINKVYVALDRYMAIRSTLGQAFCSLRSLNQLAAVFTEKQTDDPAQAWRAKMQSAVIEICDCTIRVLKNEELSAFLSRNECESAAGDDPMTLAQMLRSHLYNGSSVLSTELELMEKMTMMGMLNEYLLAYRELLKFASTPLPFPMIQMGRTFLFVWIYSMPLALVGLELQLVPVLIFIFFITYGYIGLELVAMRLLRPWGDNVNDLNIAGTRDAVVVGIDNDSLAVTGGGNQPVRREGFQKRASKGDYIDDSYRSLHADDFCHA